MADFAFGSGTNIIGDAYLDYRLCQVNDSQFVFSYIGTSSLGTSVNAHSVVVSGTQVTNGTVVGVGNLGTNKPYNGGCVDCCELGNNKFVVTYADNNSSDAGFARVGSVASNNLITLGAVGLIEAGDMEYPACTKLGDDKFVTIYNDEDNADQITGVVSTVSNTTLTAGTPEVLFASQLRARRAFTDSLNDGVFIMAGQRFGWTVVSGTVSGTDITGLGTANLWDNIYATQSVIAKIDSNRAVAVYPGTTNANLYANALTFDGITCSAGGDTSIQSGANLVQDVAPGGTKQFIVAYGGTSGRIKLCTVNWLTKEITVGSEETFETNAVGWVTIHKVSDGKILLVYADTSDQKTRAKVATFTSEDFSITQEPGGSGDLPKFSIRPFWGRDGVYDPKPGMRKVHDPKPDMKLVEDPTPQPGG